MPPLPEVEIHGGQSVRGYVLMRAGGFVDITFPHAIKFNTRIFGAEFPYKINQLLMICLTLPLVLLGLPFLFRPSASLVSCMSIAATAIGIGLGT